MKKETHTIMLTYDRIERVEVDIDLDTMRGFYLTGCMNEEFVRWIPERFAMKVMYAPGNEKAKFGAIEMAIRALYRTIPKSKVVNLEIWLDSKPMPQLQN